MTDTMPWGLDLITHWTDLLEQDEIWQDAHGAQLRLDDMEPGYCGRVAAFILKQADAAVEHITNELWSFGEPNGFQAQIDYDRGLGQFFDQTSDATAWIAEQPLTVALQRRAQGLPARQTLCACGYEIRPGWDHTECHPDIIVD